MGIETGLIILLVGVTLVAAAATLALWRHDRELTRIAELLDARDRDDASVPSQITLEVRSAGLVALARSLNAGLERERERCIAAERAQGVFQQDLASLSHDIRTPLAGAQGYLQLAQRTAEQAWWAARTGADGRYATAAAQLPALWAEYQLQNRLSD